MITKVRYNVNSTTPQGKGVSRCEVLHGGVEPAGQDETLRSDVRVCVSKLHRSEKGRNDFPQKSGAASSLASGANPSFGFSPIVLMQMCEHHPMLNIALLDTVSSITPRTIMEAKVGANDLDENGEKYGTNYYAGFEAFRREFFGLVVNCLSAGFVALGIAKVANRSVMGGFNKSNLTGAWAGGTTLDTVKSYYEDAVKTGSSDKTYETLKNMIFDLEGIEGKGVNNTKRFRDYIEKGGDFDKILRKLAGLIDGDKLGNEHFKILSEEALKKPGASKGPFQEALEYIIDRTKVSENISLKKVGKTEAKALPVNLRNFLENSSKVLHGIAKEGIGNNESALKDYFKNANNLVKVKSWGAMAIIIPLAISMQPINRWITHKMSGKKGAPIYNDFKCREHQELTLEQKAGLFKQKLISIGSMIGVSLLSMAKLPSMKMLEFRGLFPTMDQARLIATATNASRMGASEDANELREARVRDIATFASFYLLGDYVAKGVAQGCEMWGGAKLLNDTKPLEEGANTFKKALHWIKDVRLKSSEECGAIDKKVAKEAMEKLKNVTKSGKTVNNKNLRSFCQLGSLGFSMVALGVLIPWYNRTQTNKKEKARKEHLHAHKHIAARQTAQAA